LVQESLEILGIHGQLASQLLLCQRAFSYLLLDAQAMAYGSGGFPAP
jgi:hypothetical protein